MPFQTLPVDESPDFLASAAQDSCGIELRLLRILGRRTIVEIRHDAAYARLMDLHLSADQQALIREALESGRLQKPEDALKQAMSPWEECERRLMVISLAVSASEASLARGAGRIVFSSGQTSQLAEDVKRRGMKRLANQDSLRRWLIFGFRRRPSLSL